MRKPLKQRPLKIRGSMTLSGDLDKALAALKKERERSLKRLVDGLKGLTATRKTNV